MTIQTCELTEQNKILENTLVQASRPIGAFEPVPITDDSGRMVFVSQRFSEERRDRFGFGLTLLFKNVGKGPLVTEAVLNSVGVDPTYNMLDLYLDNPDQAEVTQKQFTDGPVPLQPGQRYPIEFVFRDYAFEKSYTVQALVVYSDLFGRYYSTEFWLRCVFNLPTGENEVKLVDIEPNEIYRELSEDDVKRLHTALGWNETE